MYGNLGNKHNLEVIRQMNPQPKGAQRRIHCRHLEKNANACNDMPLGNGVRGICLNNPFHPQREAKRRTLQKEFSEKYPVVIPQDVAEMLEARANDLAAAVEMGLISNLGSLTTTDFILAWDKYQTWKALHDKTIAELQAKLIIHELSKAMNKGDRK